MPVPVALDSLLRGGSDQRSIPLSSFNTDRNMDDTNALKTLDEIHGPNMDNMNTGLKTLDDFYGSNTDKLSNLLKTVDEIYGSNMGDLNELDKITGQRLKTSDGLTTLGRDIQELNISDMNEFDMLSSGAGMIPSPGTEVTACVKNDGSSIPLRKLGSLKIPAILTGK